MRSIYQISASYHNFGIKKFLKEHMTYFMKLREILIIIIIIDVIDHRADIAMQK